MKKRVNKNNNFEEFIDDLYLYCENTKYKKIIKMINSISDYCKLETNGGRVGYIDDKLTLVLYTHNSQQANRWCDIIETLGYNTYQIYTYGPPMIGVEC